MRICIFGAGAVGGHLAARFAAAGHEVSVFARGAHLEAMNARGIELRSGDEGAPKRPGGHKPSMLQDYERGRPMEVESQIMTPLAFARAAGLEVPSFELAATLAARKAADKGLYTR